MHTHPSLTHSLTHVTHTPHSLTHSRTHTPHSLSQDSKTKRNKYLVPYPKLDEAAKKSNHDTAYETIRTISALGCKITPPLSLAGDKGMTIQQLAREFSHAHVRTRTFRGQTCYKITKGKW